MDTTPVSAMGSPAALDPQEAQELQELEAVRIKTEIARKADKVANLLNATFFWTDRTFPFLRNEWNQAMMVTRFYPEVCVAVDMFMQITPEIQKDIDRKRKLFAENKAVVNGREQTIRYGVLDWSMSLLELLPQIGEV